MTVKECYEAMGADYEDVLGRLRNDDRIKKFLLKILDDKSYELLCTSIASGDAEEAYRAAHTLKGLCANFSLTKFGASASRLSDRLKEKRELGPDLDEMLSDVREDYERTVACITRLRDEQ